MPYIQVGSGKHVKRFKYRYRTGEEHAEGTTEGKKVDLSIGVQYRVVSYNVLCSVVYSPKHPLNQKKFNALYSYLHGGSKGYVHPSLRFVP